MDDRYFAELLRIPQGLVPSVPAIDIGGVNRPANGLAGGDLLLYVDFTREFDLERRLRDAPSAQLRQQLERNHNRCGILLADVAGHSLRDAVPASQLARAFRLGARYELDDHGQITTRLFEKLNNEFYRSEVHQLITMLYGEVASDGRFRFLNAAHPPPMVYSSERERFVDIDPLRMKRFLPIGTKPSEADIDVRRYETVLGYKEGYEVNELTLMGDGDTMLLMTDGVSENPGLAQYESVLRSMQGLPAQELCRELMAVLEPTDDDATLVVVRRYV